MLRFVKPLLVTSMILAATQAYAQSTNDDTDPADTPTAQTDDAPQSDAPQSDAAPRADGLSAGIAQGDDVGKTYIKSDHGDWELRCVKTPEDQPDPCQIYQLLRDQEGNSVAEINLFDLPIGDDLAAGATIITPLETLLTANLRVAVDTSKPKVYPFTFCTPIGCFSRIGLTKDEIAAFKRGSKATVTLVPAQSPDQQVDLTMSLKGFTAAFDAVIAANKIN